MKPSACLAKVTGENPAIFFLETQSTAGDVNFESKSVKRCGLWGELFAKRNEKNVLFG